MRAQQSSGQYAVDSMTAASESHIVRTDCAAVDDSTAAQSTSRPLSNTMWQPYELGGLDSTVMPGRDAEPAVSPLTVFVPRFTPPAQHGPWRYSWAAFQHPANAAKRTRNECWWECAQSANAVRCDNSWESGNRRVNRHQCYEIVDKISARIG